MGESLRFDRLGDAPDWVRNYYRIRLDVELRSARADGFQRLFDRVMRSIHGRDYRDTAALGSLGDQGCDGYLTSERAVFACYGPDPYFKIREAVSKLRGDLKTAIDRLEVPNFMQKWIFVVNYPGTHALLINEAVANSSTELTCEVWSRTDIVDAFMAGARRQALVSEFGDVPKSAKSVGRAYVVPESTALPRRGAESAVHLLRSRIQCDQNGYRRALSEWAESFAVDPYGALVAQTQLLLCSMAAITEAGYFNPEELEVESLLYEAEMSQSAWSDGGERAWNLMMSLLHSVDEVIDIEDGHTAPEVEPIGDDEDALDALMNMVVYGNKLALGLIRLYSRMSGKFETECLDEAWDWMVRIPVMASDREHKRHAEQLKKAGVFDKI